MLFALKPETVGLAFEKRLRPEYAKRSGQVGGIACVTASKLVAIYALMKCNTAEAVVKS